MVDRTVAERVESAVRKVYAVDAAAFPWHADFEDDLRGDSLDHVELTAAIEQEFGVDISDAIASRWTHPQHIADYFNERRGR